MGVGIVWSEQLARFITLDSNAAEEDLERLFRGVMVASVQVGWLGWAYD